MFTSLFQAGSVTSPRADRVQSAQQAMSATTATPDRAEAGAGSKDAQQVSLQERVERAKKILAEKQALKAQEEADVRRRFL